MENRIDKILSSVAEDLWGAQPQEPAQEALVQPEIPAYQPSFPPFE